MTAHYHAAQYQSNNAFVSVNNRMTDDIREARIFHLEDDPEAGFYSAPTFRWVPVALSRAEEFAE